MTNIDAHQPVNDRHRTSKYLTFMLATEEYAVDILSVQEIKSWDKITRLPNAPDYIRGVVNLRGTIVPIIDLRLRFGLEKLEYGAMTVMVIVHLQRGGQKRVTGLIVDAVSDVYDVVDDEICPPPDFGSIIHIEFVKGLATVEDKMVIVLDIEHMLNADDLALVDKLSS